MPAASFSQALHLTIFCSPKCDRRLYRRVRRTRPRRLVELGMGDGTRAVRLLQLAARYQPGVKLAYTGIDLFEARSPGASLSLKRVYHRLSRTGARIRLVPGEVASALARTANMLTETDLIVIDASDEELAPAWFYLPRMLHARTVIARYQLRGPQKDLVWLDPRELGSQARRAA